MMIKPWIKTAQKKILLGFILFLVAIVMTILFGVALELGTRQLFSFRGNASINGPHFKSTWNPPPPTYIPEPTAKFAHSIPTAILSKAKFSGPELKPQSDSLDKSKGGVPGETVDGVFKIKSKLSHKSIVRIKDTHEILYEVHVETDNLGRRITPTPNQQDKNQHLIFLGCSFTYGEGVEQNQTLPYYAAAATQNYKSYNLGINGGSIVDAWAFTHVLDQFQNIPERNGKAIYIFIDDHINRYVGTMYNIAAWIYSRPYVRLDENNEIKFYGPWKTARPLLVKLSQFFSKSYFLRTIGFNATFVTRKNIEDYAKIIADVKRKYHEKFGRENQFVVVLYFDASIVYADPLKLYLEKEGIDYLDYSTVRLNQLSNEAVFIPLFGHPNALANQLVGQSIADDLKIR